MRLKVESVPPLPHVKAWFSANALPSVLDLKTSLCTDLHALKQGRVQPQDILLLLDDFELLDSSSIDVVRDGDLIVIKKRPASTAAKRKAPSESPAPARKRSRTDDARAASRKPSVAKGSNTIRPALAAASESSSDSDSDSDSDSSDDSSSDADSDADSDSDASDSESSSDESTSSSSTSTSTSSSTSTSASSARPTIRPRQPKPANDAPKAPQPSKPAPPPVPPGLGKPATHSRNLRRRRKKMYERLSQTAEPASANAVPLGTRARTAAAASEEPEQQPQPPTPTQVNGKTKGKEPERQQSGEAAPPAFMMASLQNKNKRRGFKNAMSQGVPAKIYFPDAAGSSSSSSSQAQHEEQQQSMDVDPDAQLVEAALQPHPSPPTTSTPSRPVSRAQPRLVPPSEKQALGQLPANVFVTSVDVEEGLWPTRGKKAKKKKKKQVQVEEEEYYEEDTFAGGLPYDDPPEDPVAEVAVAQSKEPVAESTEHAVVAAQWDTLRKVTDKSQLAPGATVGWKALGINFATLTPEMLLHIGRVIRCDDQLVVEPFAEPSVEELSFGGAVVAEEGGAAEETFEWPDVFSGDWRLVSVAR
ncbi:hypothetical protein PYCCODRAFT_1411887 [Trametes coccinea BRFM310]|uniref:Coilin n=1 Tax=Trametes coccinea (strain BRFM310) TaxID=1353009 RepID=A0A1Y2IKQ1_TRAC3|nr:hypothetical protein PYCCODRAFT_1411887 [Trametes coccinea BRFM310]